MKKQKIEPVKKLTEFHFKVSDSIDEFAAPFSKELTSLFEKYGITDAVTIISLNLYDESEVSYAGSIPFFMGHLIRNTTSVIDQARIMRNDLVKKFERL